MIDYLLYSVEDAKRYRNNIARKKYLQKHPDRVKETQHRWYVNNTQKAKARHDRWRKANPEKARETNRNWFKLHPEHRNVDKAWQKNNPTRYKEIRKRKAAKRNRELGYYPLNSHFNHSEAHHINEEVVIYIPYEFHRSFPHNHNISNTMIKINQIAWDYLECEKL